MSKRSVFALTAVVAALLAGGSGVVAQTSTGQPYDPEQDWQMAATLDLLEENGAEDTGEWSVVDPRDGAVVASGAQLAFQGSDWKNLVWVPDSSYCYRLLSAASLERALLEGSPFTPPTDTEVLGCTKALAAPSQGLTLLPTTQAGAVASLDALLACHKSALRVAKYAQRLEKQGRR